MATYSDNTPENPSSVDAAIQQQMKEGRYQFTDEEKRALQECRFESFWYRSFPIAAFSGVSTHMLVQRGFLNPSKRFGSVPKVVFATMCGYIFGKMLYVQKCREKFLKLKNSPFAEMMRRGRGGMPPSNFGGMSIPGYGSDPPVEEELSVDDTFRPDTPWSGGHDQRLNMDIDTSQVKGINNTFDSDLPIQREDDAAASKREFTGTYDELRKHHRAKNAQQYTQVLPGHYQPRSPPDAPKQDQPRPRPQQPGQDEFSLGARNRNRMLNKYGDSWEKE